MRITSKCYTLFNGFISKKLHHYSQFQPSSLTIQQVMFALTSYLAFSTWILVDMEPQSPPMFFLKTNY